jgi:intein-encoded DNA endonuclease-like protein
MGKVKIPESEYDNIINLYKQGLSQQQIADVYGIHRDTVKYIFNKRGISRKDKPDLFNDIEKTDIVSLYMGGETTISIAKKYNVSDETIRRWLDNLGIKRRSTKYHFSYNYFDVIDDQNKAYILGLLYADGYNNVDKHCISITLQEKDKHILESINDLLESDRPLRFVNNHKKNKNWSDCYQLMLTNEHLSKTLEYYGMVQAKSLILKFPSWIDESLLSHFLRGYIDGDGHISKKKSGGGVSLVGTEDFCIAVQSILKDRLGIESKIYIPKNAKNTRTLIVNKKHDSKVFLDFIYNDANLFLTRKFNTYKLKYYNNENINNTLTA